MNSKLYVGNLPFQTTDEDLEALFSVHGTVAQASVITDRETGRSRGFGFVTFDTDEAAQTAQAALDGQDYNGRALKVNEAQDKKKATSTFNRR